MENEIHPILKIYFAHQTQNIGELIHHLEKITNSLFTLTQCLFDNKEKIKHHQRDMEGKLFRFGLANHSIIKLIQNDELILIDKKVRIGDIFSINSITRMQIESFLIMYYLFFDSINDSEKDFRYDVYKLHGLLKQLGFKSESEFPGKEENVNKINSEIKETIESIKNSVFYNAANEKSKAKFLNPEYARLIKSDELFKNSGLTNTKIRDAWHLLSNYVHSEYISDRQFNSMYGTDKSIKDSLSLIITFNSIMTSRLARHLIETFESVKIKFSSLDNENKQLINFWGSLNTNKP